MWPLGNEQVQHLPDVCLTFFLHSKHQQLDLFVVSFYLFVYFVIEFI